MVFAMKECWTSKYSGKSSSALFWFGKNHAMVDGNKKLNTHVMLVFLALNGYELSYSQKELSGMIRALASGNIGEKEIIQWIIEHQK